MTHAAAAIRGGSTADAIEALNPGTLLCGFNVDCFFDITGNGNEEVTNEDDVRAASAESLRRFQTAAGILTESYFPSNV